MKLPIAINRWIWKQDWLSLKSRKLAYRALDKAGEAPDAPFEMDFFGLRYQGNLNNGIEFAMYHYGAFEKPLLFFLRDAYRALVKTRSDAGCFCDIGANIGQHSLFMCHIARQIHAFEPFAQVRNRLQQHIQLNNLPHVSVHPVGVGNASVAQEFYAPSGSNQGIGSFLPNTQAKGNSPIGELQVVKGDDYFAEKGIPAPCLIKIDVEGYEKDVLSGLAKTLAAQRPVIVCEVSYEEARSFTSHEDLLQCLPENYSVFRFATRNPDGSTAKRRGSRAKRTGEYRLESLSGWSKLEQDDLILVPAEFLPDLPRQNP